MTEQTKVTESKWYMCDQCGYSITSDKKKLNSLAHTLVLHGKTYHFHSHKYPHKETDIPTYPWDDGTEDCLARWLLAHNHKSKGKYGHAQTYAVKF